EFVPYPKGFVPPSFAQFDGTGNPRQHLAQYRALCCNISNNNALLLRLFVTSLSGFAFEWYTNLPNGSFKTFKELEEVFVKRFVGVQKKITIHDLMTLQQKPTEAVVDYILRWRTLALKCEPPLQENHAVNLLLGRLTGSISLLLKLSSIFTFEKLLSKAASLQGEASSLILKEEPYEKARKKLTPSSKKPVDTISLTDKQVKGSEETLQVTPSPQKKNPLTFQERLDRIYSFKKDAVPKLFQLLIKAGMQLPEPKKPKEVSKTDDPTFCPYHRCLGHTIENCITFKDWLER
ncbi:hypothetical protein, partial [Robertmurraya kyonggiensis]